MVRMVLVCYIFGVIKAHVTLVQDVYYIVHDIVRGMHINGIVGFAPLNIFLERKGGQCIDMQGDRLEDR